MDACATPGWPKNAIPVEIFDEITQHLQLSDLRSLRLVCREFLQKTSANLVHTLGIHFKPTSCPLPQDLLNPLPEHGGTLITQYGRYVRRFTVRLEANEGQLLCPLIMKPDYEFVPATWGFYLWPRLEQSGDPNILGLEAAAEDTKGLTAALAAMVEVKELTISCDAGWGRLFGPEINSVAAKVSRDHHHQKIGLPTWRSRPSIGNTGLFQAPEPSKESIFMRQQSTFSNMALDAGVAEDFVGSVLEFVELENILASKATTLSLAELESGINPANLNRLQKEYLLRMDYACWALVHSWSVAISNLCRSGGFCSLVCVRFAKLPSSHLSILTSEYFWESLTNVKEIHLQPVADWRRVSWDSEHEAVDQDLAPENAVVDAYRLLRLISKQRNITTLHFEWLCGGELSLGGQRGRYILPAPFVSRPELMVEKNIVSLSQDILILPNVTNLSVKNCWFSPHVFLYAARKLARCSLVELKLESVSLSGPARASENGQIPFPLRRQLRNLVPRPLSQHPGQPPPPPPLTATDWQTVLTQATGIPQVPMGLIELMALEDADEGLDMALDPYLPFGPPQTTQPAQVSQPSPDPLTAALQGVLVSSLNADPLSTPPLFPGSALPVTETEDTPELELPPLIQPGAAPADASVLDFAMGQLGIPIAQDAPAVDVAANPPARSRLLNWPGVIDSLSSGPKIPKSPALNNDEKPKAAVAPHPTIRRMDFKSCGYVAVESRRIQTVPRLGTWPSLARHYKWTIRGGPKNSPHGFPWAKDMAMQENWSELNGWITPQLPQDEEKLLEEVFGMRIGWAGVYDEETVEMAKAVNPTEPGVGRFSGVVEGEEK